MINLQQRIDILSQLGQMLGQANTAYEKAVNKAIGDNGWFTTESIKTALHAIKHQFLDTEKLNRWAASYQLPENPAKQLSIGLVMAGNIPMVGFHDLLAVFVCGHRAQIKLSAKDTALLLYTLDLLTAINPQIADYFQITDTLKDFDAVIATGNNNTSRYFNYYFGQYPHVIRKHRNSIAVLWGDETQRDIVALGQDIFQYFGLGCRNVSKLYIPLNYDFVFLLDNLAPFSDTMLHHKYKNNYDYYRSILLLNKEPHLASDFLMLVEKNSLASPVSALYYEYFEDENDLSNKIIEQKDLLQCVVSQPKRWGNCLPFGKTQEPALNDYADQNDIMLFLSSL